MAELKLSDFVQMLGTSSSTAFELGADEENLLVQIEDEEGDLYDIVDVKFNPMTRAIHIKFDHDNAGDKQEEWQEKNPPFPSIEPI